MTPGGGAASKAGEIAGAPVVVGRSRCSCGRPVPSELLSPRTLQYRPIMTDHPDPGDRHVYEAKGDFEMDAILNAAGKASSAPAFENAGATGEDWAGSKR